MKKHVKLGLLLIALGSFVIYWAQTHSPKNIGQAIGNAFSGSYTMSETNYYISLGIGIILCVYGILKILKKAWGFLMYQYVIHYHFQWMELRRYKEIFNKISSFSLVGDFSIVPHSKWRYYYYNYYHKTHSVSFRLHCFLQNVSRIS